MVVGGFRSFHVLVLTRKRAEDSNEWRRTGKIFLLFLCLCRENASLLPFSLVLSFMVERLLCALLFIIYLFIQLVIIELFSRSNGEVNLVSYNPTAKRRIQIRRE